MIPRSCVSTWAAGLLLLAVPMSAEVLREPESPHFELIIRPMLTPLEEAVEMDTAAAEEFADAAVLVLEEELHAVDAEARSVVALHRIVKPLTEAGVEAASRLVFPYNGSFQRVFLHTARTRAANGEIAHVGKDAAFIQTPQHLADEGIYSDVEELVVLFSNVKPGHLVEWIVVVEVDEPRMPGCWGTVVHPGGYWPMARFRSRIDIEEPLASSLRIAPRGGPLPETTTPPSRPNWRAWEWVETDSSPMRQEVDRAPGAQFGRVLRLTTVATWDQVARWYAALLASRNSLTPDLAKRVDEWTRGLDNPRRVLEVLLAKVADEVRYTGLEFGMGALRPRSPDAVWSSQYGDCKDKSNLLRVMLASRGVESYLVLLNTEHAGRIETEAPHYSQFNHAILAVDLPQGRVFCDPTVEGLPAGVLRPSDAGRQALLVGDSTGELLTIPGQDGGTVRFAFEIEVDALGGHRGWMEVSTAGSITAPYREFFGSADASFRHQRYHMLLSRFFEGADLIDVEFPEPPTPRELAFLARGYFVVNGVKSHGGSPSTLLRFPHGDVVFPDLDAGDGRETPWYQNRKLTELEIRYRLPEGWHEQSALPLPLKVSSPEATVRGQWGRDEEGVMTARLSYRTETDLVEPRAYSRLRQAVVTARTWMDRPVAVGAGGEAPMYEDAREIEVDLPLMPTGEGQLRLVNRVYPTEGDRGLRRAALTQVSLLFPESSETLFDVEIWRAQLDAMEDHPELSVPRVERAIDMYGDSVPRETVAWAQYHLAHHLQRLGETDRSIAILRKLAGNESLTPFRRATAAELLGVLLAENGEVAAAVRVLDEGIAIESEMHAELTGLRSRIMVGNGQAGDLRSTLIREMLSSPHMVDWTFETLRETVTELLGEGETADAAALAGVLLSVADASPQLQLDDHQEAELAEICRTTVAYSEIAEAIGVYLEDPSSDWIRNAESEPAGSIVEMAAAMSRFDADGRIAEYVRCGLERLALHGTAVGDFGSNLWQLAAVTNANRPGDPVLDDLIGWGLLLPKSDEYFLETIFLEAQQLERRGRAEEALALLREWSENREIGPVFRVAFLAEAGKALERAGRWEDALDTYRSLEPERSANLSGYDALLRAVFLNLGLGRYDQALRVIDLLAELDDEERLYCESPGQIAELVALAGNPERAKRYWSLQRDWMPVWLSLERSIGLDPTPELVVPVIPDIFQVAGYMGRAVAAEAPKTYFQDLRRFVHAARWQPEMVFEVCSLSESTSRMAGEHRELAQALVVALANGLDIGDASIYKRSRHLLAMYYVNHEQYPQAVTLGREYFERFEANDPLGRGVLRLWGLAGAQSGLDGQILVDRLERQLAEEDLEGERTATVFVLAELYRSLGLSKKELDLIKTEIIDGERDHERFGERLENRYAALLDEPQGKNEFTAAVDSWLGEFSPAWFGAEKPSSLRDSLAKEIGRDIENRPERYSRTELIKYRLLVARDPTRPFLDRQQDFSRAVADLEELCVSTEKADAMIMGVLDDDRLSTFAHWYVPWRALDTAFERGNRKRLEWWLQSDRSKDWRPSLRQRTERLLKGLPLPSDGMATIENIAVLLLGDPLDDVDVRVLRRLTERLMQLGEFEKVAEIVGLLADAEFETVVESRGAALRLELRRLMAEYEAERPATEAMRDALLEGMGDIIFERPQVLDDVPDTDRLDHLSGNGALAVRLYLAATRQYEPQNQLFWALLARGIQDFHDGEIARQMLERALEAEIRDDALPGIVMMMSTACFDIDDPDDQARLEEKLASLRDDFGRPLSRASAVVVSAMVATRAGREVNLSAVDEAAKELDAEWVAHRLELIKARREGKSRLRRHLESMPTDMLLNPVMIPEILPALRLVGMNSEADLVAEVGRELVRDEVLRSWSTVDGWAARQVLDLCEGLGDEGCIPVTWRDEMVKAFNANEISLRIQLVDAELREDWKTARDTAAAIVAKKPKIYDLYWRLGRAEARLGNDDAAVDALSTFVRYCGDSMYLADANALLVALRRAKACRISNADTQGAQGATFTIAPLSDASISAEW